VRNVLNAEYAKDVISARRVVKERIVIINANVNEEHTEAKKLRVDAADV